MKDVAESTLTRRQRYWLEHLQACSAADVTIAEYTSAQGLKAHAMYAAKKRLLSKGVLVGTQPHRFQRVRVAGPVVAAGHEWRIQLPNGLSVTFSGVVDSCSLSTVLSTVMAFD